MIFWGDFVVRWTEVLSRWEAFVLGQPLNVDSYYHIMKDILPSCLGQDFFGAIQLHIWILRAFRSELIPFPSVIRSFDLELCGICVDLGYTWYFLQYFISHSYSYGICRWILYPMCTVRYIHPGSACNNSQYFLVVSNSSVCQLRPNHL